MQSASASTLRGSDLRCVTRACPFGAARAPRAGARRSGGYVNGPSDSGSPGRIAASSTARLRIKSKTSPWWSPPPTGAPLTNRRGRATTEPTQRLIEVVVVTRHEPKNNALPHGPRKVLVDGGEFVGSKPQQFVSAMSAQLRQPVPNQPRQTQ